MRLEKVMCIVCRKYHNKTGLSGIRFVTHWQLAIDVFWAIATVAHPYAMPIIQFASHNSNVLKRISMRQTFLFAYTYVLLWSSSVNGQQQRVLNYFELVTVNKRKLFVASVILRLIFVFSSHRSFPLQFLFTFFIRCSAHSPLHQKQFNQLDSFVRR